MIWNVRYNYKILYNLLILWVALTGERVDSTFQHFEFNYRESIQSYLSHSRYTFAWPVNMVILTFQHYLIARLNIWPVVSNIGKWSRGKNINDSKFVCDHCCLSSIFHSRRGCSEEKEIFIQLGAQNRGSNNVDYESLLINRCCD